MSTPTRDEATAANRALWDASADYHRDDPQWRALLDGFATPGFSFLDAVETEMFERIGVAGKAVAQLCCNNGREILSVRNLGAAHSGTSDFWRQRITGVAMTLLMIPALVIIMMLLGRNQVYVAQTLSSIPVAVILLLFIFASAWHMKIGMQVVIEDYVHNEKLKLTAIMLNNFFSAAVALASTYAVLKLSSGV